MNIQNDYRYDPEDVPLFDRTRFGEGANLELDVEADDMVLAPVGNYFTTQELQLGALQSSN